MTQLFDFIMHIDEHLITIVNSFGPWTYAILFAMVFIETGVVIFPSCLVIHCYLLQARWLQMPRIT